MFYQGVAATLVILCSSVFAEDTIVYRWVDKDNVVHYSHEHPADKDYSEVKVQVAYSAPVIDSTADLKTTSEDENTSNQNDGQQLSPEEITQHCESARVNLNVLDSFERITIKDENGLARLLTDDEKQEQIELSNKYIEVYCESAQRLSKSLK